MLDQLYVDHIVFRVRDLAETELFYRKLLGTDAFQGDDTLMYKVGETRLFFTASDQQSAMRYDKEQPGLNHLAFGVDGPAALREILDRLNVADVQHSGILIDHYGNKEFIWLDDPNGFRLEFYWRPT